MDIITKFKEEFEKALWQAKRDEIISSTLFGNIMGDLKKLRSIPQFTAILKARYKPFEFIRIQPIITEASDKVIPQGS